MYITLHLFLSRGIVYLKWLIAKIPVFVCLILLPSPFEKKSSIASAIQAHPSTKPDDRVGGRLFVLITRPFFQL